MFSNYILPFEHFIILSLCYSFFQSAQYRPFNDKNVCLRKLGKIVYIYIHVYYTQPV